jgi:ABC-type multidrug transport system fused ATPase/permease subunit
MVVSTSWFMELTWHSGKSTFVSVLLRLMDQSTGAILVDGIDIGTVSRNSLGSI